MANPKGAVASFNPDNMEGTGLQDDFDGEIVKVRLVPWDYGQPNRDYSLFAAVTIRPDEDSGYEEFEQMYSAGDLAQFMPSKDGEEPVNIQAWVEDGASADSREDVEGVFALRVGKYENLNKNTNFAFFLKALQNAGYDQFSANVSDLEGIYGHFNRVPQPKRPGIVVESGEGGESKSDRARTILVVTQLKDKPKSASKSTAAAKGKAKVSAKAAAEEPAAKSGASDFDDQVAEAIVAILRANDGTIAKGKIAPQLVKAYRGSDKPKVIKRAGDVEFLSSREEQWVYDADEGTLTLIAE